MYALQPLKLLVTMQEQRTAGSVKLRCGVRPLAKVRFGLSALEMDFSPVDQFSTISPACSGCSLIRKYALCRLISAS